MSVTRSILAGWAGPFGSSPVGLLALDEIAPLPGSEHFIQPNYSTRIFQSLDQSVSINHSTVALDPITILIEVFNSLG